MTAKIRREYGFDAKEINIDCGGYSFLTVCGCHVNGAFAAFLNWGLSFELSAHEIDISSNAETIANGLKTAREAGNVGFCADDSYCEELGQALARALVPFICDNGKRSQLETDKMMKSLGFKKATDTDTASRYIKEA